MAIAAALAEPKLRIAAHLFYGQTCHAVGLYERGTELLRLNTQSLESELTRRGDRPAQQIYSRGLLTCCLVERQRTALR